MLGRACSPHELNAQTSIALGPKFESPENNDFHRDTVGKHQEEHPGLLKVPRIALEYTKNIPKNIPKIYQNASKIYPRYPT